jgi:hypothetical protein
MQIREHAPIHVEEMTVIELDDVRHSLRLSKKQVCQRAGINQSTYQRWLKWARGEPDGCQPQPRSIRALREVLSAEFGYPSKTAPGEALGDAAGESRRVGAAGEFRTGSSQSARSGKPDRAA